jgi:hypothetical protein
MEIIQANIYHQTPGGHTAYYYNSPTTRKVPSRAIHIFEESKKIIDVQDYVLGSLDPQLRIALRVCHQKHEKQQVHH